MTPTSRALRWAPSAAAVCALLVLAPATITPAAEQDTSSPRLEIVLDASGSMRHADAGGQSRLTAANRAVSQLLDGAPAGTPMGLRVYGATYAGTAKSRGCRDTQQLHPVAPLDEQSVTTVKNKITRVRAVGMTPIGTSLRAAAHDLGSIGSRRIILLSDGEDTCSPPSPCQVAQELRGAGVDIDVVGLHVERAARRQLRCIAEAADGTYVDATDAGDLVDGLHRSLTRALTPYQVSGTHTHGTADCTHAPVLRPGQYQDAISYQQQRRYRIPIAPGQALHMSAAIIPTDVYQDAAVTRIRVYLPGQSTWWAADQALSSNALNVISTGVHTPRLSWPQIPAGQADTMACAQVINDVHGPTGAQPVELAVHLTGAIDDGATRTPNASRPHPTAAADTSARGEAGVDHRLVLCFALAGILAGLLARTALDYHRRIR